MANTDLIVPLVVAGIGLFGTAISLLLTWRNQRRSERDTKEMNERLESVKIEVDHKQTVTNMTDKYSQPLLVAAYDLQQRLYELVEYPISRQHISMDEGLDDIKLFTCYLLAQYLVFAHILRTKTGYLSFSQEPKMKLLRSIMYMIDEELDRRRNSITNRNYGVWPASRILVSERMIVSETETNDTLGDVGGGFGIKVKGFDDFKKAWTAEFQQPMHYFCEWIDGMLDGRLCEKPWSDTAMRCLQHLLVDLVAVLDRGIAYIPEDPEKLKCERSAVDCDCQGDGCRDGGSLDEALLTRQESRLNDAGLWPRYGKHKRRTTDKYDYSLDRGIDLDMVKSMTYRVSPV